MKFTAKQISSAFDIDLQDVMTIFGSRESCTLDEFERISPFFIYNKEEFIMKMEQEKSLKQLQWEIAKKIVDDRFKSGK